MSQIKLALSIEETNQLLAVLGDQPIKSGLTDLTTKIKTQGDAQVASIKTEQVHNDAYIDAEITHS
jgi:hypothetical protein